MNMHVRPGILAGAMLLLLAECGEAGRDPVEPLTDATSDQEARADGAGGDGTGADGTGEPGVGRQDVGREEGEAICAATCGGRCGTVDDCDCGKCKPGEECSKEQKCEPVSQYDCENLCQKKKWECGLLPGPAGCQCGYCAPGEDCDQGKCGAPPSCAEVCGDKVCGEFDACMCGVCMGDEFCTPDGYCSMEVDCTYACDPGFDCGWIGDCDCGECDDGWACNEMYNLCECMPTCEDPWTGQYYECGDDGCGWSCGECPIGGEWDCVEHICECSPDCAGKECGSDGCAWTCGECFDDEQCGYDGLCHFCDLANFVFEGPVVKISSFAVGKGGHPGEGLDVDGDPDTCAPAGDCSGGINNAMSGLLQQLEQFVDMDAEFAKMLDQGKLIIVAQHPGFNTAGAWFTVNAYFASPFADKSMCDFQQESCDYFVQPSSFDVTTCMPLISADNGKVSLSTATAGGQEHDVYVPFGFAMFMGLDPASSWSMVQAHGFQLAGKVVGQGPEMHIEDGLVGGAMEKDDILGSVDAIPPDVAAELPVSTDMIKNLLNMFLIPDIDGDGDGELDSVSFGFKVETIPGTILGVGP